MGYKIDTVEGIGKVNARKLAKAGAKTTDSLLKKCGAPKGRREMAATTGFTEAQLLKWANMADLMRIKGVGEEYSELLEAAGVDTVKEMKTRRADNLCAKMLQVNKRKKLVRRPPSEAMVGRWIKDAKSLKAMIRH